MNKLALLLAAVLCAAPVMAQQQPNALRAPAVIRVSTSNHLDPVQPVPDDRFLVAYENNLHKAFAEIYADSVRVSMIAQPSFTPEYSVGIVEAGDAYRVLYLREPTNLWYHNRSKSPLTAERCEVGIDASLAKRLVESWRRMLLRVPSDAHIRMGLDGELYIFSMRTKKQQLSGQTWSPDEGTMPARLVDIGIALTRYCRAKEVWLFRPASWYFAASLNRQIDELLAKIPTDGTTK
jgi:hypothetical protein